MFGYHPISQKHDICAKTCIFFILSTQVYFVLEYKQILNNLYILYNKYTPLFRVSTEAKIGLVS